MKKYLLVLISLFIIPQSNAQKPVANFSAEKDTICFNDCISFSDSSTNNPTSWQWTFEGALPQTSTDQNPFVCYLDSGSFDVKLVVSNSFSSDSITMNNLILVNPSPPLPTITQIGDTLFCSTDSSYISYQWYDSTALIPGATDTFLIITHLGNYNVVVSNAFGCKIAVGLNGCICGINNYYDDNRIALSPNPATNQLTIYASSFHISEGVTVSIMNMLGQMTSPPTPLLQERGAAMIDVSLLPASIYFLQLKSDSGNIVKKFIKQ